jgi:hypothetical protein
MLKKGSSPVIYNRNSFATRASLKNVSVGSPVFLRFSCKEPRIPQIVMLYLLYFLISDLNYSMASWEGVLISMFIGILGNYLKTSSSKGMRNPSVFYMYSLNAKSKAILGRKFGNFSYSKDSIWSATPHVLARLESWCTTSFLSLVKQTSIYSISTGDFSRH